MAQKTPATIATKDATEEKRPVIKPLTAAKIRITIIMMSTIFIFKNFCKSTSFFYKLKMGIVSLHLKRFL